MNKANFFLNSKLYWLCIASFPFGILIFLILKNNAIYFQTLLMAIHVAICIRLILPFSKLKKYKEQYEQQVDFYILGYSIKIFLQFLIIFICIYYFIYVDTIDNTIGFIVRGETLDPIIKLVIKSYISFAFFYVILSIDIKKEDKKPDKTRF